MSESSTSTSNIKCHYDGCSNEASPDKLYRCSRCKTVHYCSSECQTGDWGIHKSDCRATVPEFVTGVTIACDGERPNAPMFASSCIPATHLIHFQGDVCPVSEVLGIPLVIYRHLKEDPLYMTRTSDLDNQIATYLMIDVDSGFAPPRWQQCVGTVTVMRQDFKPLTNQHIEMFWMYNSHLLDMFGEGDGFRPRAYIKPSRFRRWCQKYKEEVNEYGTRDDFRDVVLPI